jgi:hypothetical protein
VKRFTARPAVRGEIGVVLQTHDSEETIMSRFENIAFVLLMAGWMILDGLYVLSTIALP